MLGKWLLLCALLAVFTAIHSSSELDDDWDLEDLDSEDGITATGTLGDVAVAQARNLLVVLTDHNAQKMIASHEHILLLGYASWCTRSSALMPEFAKAASDLAGSVLFAKLDALSNPKTASLYNIKGFPTVLFFTNGSFEIYPGGDTKEEIVNWVRKKIGSPASTILSHEVAHSVKSSSVFVGGLFSKFEGDEYDAFLQAAKQEIGTEFIQTTNLEIAQALNSEVHKPPAIWIQKNEPEQVVYFDGPFKPDEIFHFVELNKLPLVVKMTSKNSAKINASPVKLQILLFAETGDAETILPWYQEVARNYKGKMLFLLVDYADEDVAMPLLSVYGLPPGNPILAGFDYESGSKYLLEKALNSDSLKLFCDGILSHQTPQYYKSQPVPDKEKGHLKIVVGKTFETVVLDETKDVFLQVTTPWCASCESANKTVEKLASYFKDTPSLIIAQIDASANEHPLLQVVDEYPAFLFYPAGNKSKPVLASSKSKLKSLIHFVKQNAGADSAEDSRSKEEL